MKVTLKKGSMAYACYGKTETEEGYYCNFGLNPAFIVFLKNKQLVISGMDEDDEIRIIEIPGHCFFVATLFVPQVNSTSEYPHPVVKRFIEEVCMIL